MALPHSAFVARVHLAYEHKMTSPNLEAWGEHGKKQGLRLASLEEILWGTPEQLFSNAGSPIFVRDEDRYDTMEWRNGEGCVRRKELKVGLEVWVRRDRGEEDVATITRLDLTLQAWGKVRVLVTPPIRQIPYWTDSKNIMRPCD